jgi:hypothetical protein
VKIKIDHQQTNTDEVFFFKDFHRTQKSFSLSQFILCSYSDLFGLDADMRKKGQSVNEKMFEEFFVSRCNCSLGKKKKCFCLMRFN